MLALSLSTVFSSYLLLYIVNFFVIKIQTCCIWCHWGKEVLSMRICDNLARSLAILKVCCSYECQIFQNPLVFLCLSCLSPVWNLSLSLAKKSFFFFRATSTAYGSSQARSWIRAVLSALDHSHSNVKHQIQAMSVTCNTRCLTHWVRPGIKSVSSWILARFISAEPDGNSRNLILRGSTSFISFSYNLLLY